MRRRRPRARSDRRVLDEAGGLGAMTWVMAIMLFLTVLAAALGLGTTAAARLLAHDIAGKVSVQIVDGNPATRDAAALAVVAALRRTPGVATVAPVDRAELARLLRPWLGSDGADPSLPMPALIDVSLADTGDAALARVVAAVHGVAPAARVDRHEAWMSPVGDVMRTVVALALALVVLMAVATAAVVMLAARAGLETHRATIEVMHMLGSTDVQVARLFQRRIGFDALIGGAIGGTLALALTALVQVQLAGIGSQLVGGATLGDGDWLVLALLPVLFVGLAMLAARIAVLRRLRRIL